MDRTFFHTQEYRDYSLMAPIPCKRDDAWLGEGFYFWLDLDDAQNWGITSKTKTGSYEIYTSQIDTENVLDSVFNEDHYNFWHAQITKVAMKIIKATNMKPTIKELNDYFKERGTWDDVSGILFQDLPTNPNKLLIQPIQYKNKQIVFPYRKRIQLVVYNSEIILTFAPKLKANCF